MAPLGDVGDKDPVGDDLAELVEVTRRCGGESSLVLHGGGNTSLKRVGSGPAGRPRRELWIKATGRDMASIAADGFTALELDRLTPLEEVADLADADMEAVFAQARVSPAAPLPSIETLFHAYVPAVCVIHTHADAVLVLGAQPDGPSLLAETLGPTFAALPYVRPGQALARAGADAVRRRPDLVGIAFAHHGLFTFGATPLEATERMFAAVELCRRTAEQLAARRPARVRPDAPSLALSDDDARRAAAPLAPILRGALAAPSGDEDRPHQRLVAQFRTSPGIRAALADSAAVELALRGVLTADHLIHTRQRPLVFDTHAGEDPAQTAERLRRQVSIYTAEYLACIERHGGAQLEPGDSLPRVVLVPGVGLFGTGPSAREASIAADIASASLPARLLAERIGRFLPLEEADALAIEFWGPERAKLRARPAGPLAGRVALVTGAAGAIGCGVALELALAGACVVMADRPGDEHGARLQRAALRVTREAGSGSALTCAFDVTDDGDTARAFAEIALATGGPDLLVLSHGAALVGDIAELAPDSVRRIFGINAFGAFTVLGAFARQVAAQGTGGDVVLISTKNVPEPGASFAAYSASKAAAHQLARVAAIELAPLDVRVNMVSPDAVFGDEENPSLLWRDVGSERARSKGIDPATLPEQYRQRNLLKSRVTARHVAEAVLFFAERRSPTTGAVLPVDGGLPGAFPR